MLRKRAAMSTQPDNTPVDGATVQILQTLATVLEKLNGIGEKIRDQGDSIKAGAAVTTALEKSMTDKMDAAAKVVDERLSKVEKKLQSYEDRFVGGKTVVFFAGSFAGAVAMLFFAWIHAGTPGIH
jgi:hypothetical protein